MSPTSSPSGMSNAASSTLSVTVPGSPTVSPQAGLHGPTASTLVSRTSQVMSRPRKCGNLPKHATNFLKHWLYLHSDHPYPSEEEKKYLCDATGLSMSQVSNWMNNARRRILVPARHGNSDSTPTIPFGALSGVSIPGMAGGMTSPLLGPPVLETGQHPSMPTDTRQLHYPMSLQAFTHHQMPQSSTRQMVGMTRSLSTSHAPQSMALGHHGHGQSPYALSNSYNPSGLACGANGASVALHAWPHHSALRRSSGGLSSASFLESQSGTYSSTDPDAQNHIHTSSLRLSSDDSVVSRSFPEDTGSSGP